MKHKVMIQKTGIRRLNLHLAFLVLALSIFAGTLAITDDDTASYADSDQTFVFEGVDYEINIDGTVTALGMHDGYDTIKDLPSKIEYEGTTYTISAIADGAFANTKGFGYLSIPNSVKTIGDRAFYGSQTMWAVYIPDSVVSIGDEAFCDSVRLERVGIGSGLESIGHRAFGGCDSLREFDVDRENPNYISTHFQEILYDSRNASIVRYAPSSGSEVLRLSEYGFRSIGEYAFEGTKNLKELYTTNYLTIGEGTFKDSRIERVYLGNQITDIPDFAFKGCIKLNFVEYSNKLRTIGNEAFANCIELEYMDVDVRTYGLYLIYVESIGDYAFDNCHSLTKVGFNSDTVVGRGAFRDCGSLVEAERVPGPNVAIGMMENCINLETVTLSRTVRSVGQDAFKGCRSLTSLEMDDTVTSFDRDAFKGCTSLKTILVNKVSGTTISFSGQNISNLEIISNDKFYDLIVLSGSSEGSEINPGTYKGLAHYEWRPRPGTEVTVTFDSMGGTDVPSQIIDRGTTPIKPTDPTRDGFVFMGWFKDKGGAFEFNFSTSLEEDITLYAFWLPNEVKTYTIRFDSRGGTQVPSIEVEAGDIPTRPDDPTRPGYVFDGWYTDPGTLSLFDWSKTVNKNIALYAKWVVAETEMFTVTFDTDGGSTISSQTVAKGETPNRPNDPIKTGYKFEGWFSDSNLKEPFDFEEPIVSDTVVYAKWIESGTSIELHRVVFDSLGGTAIPDQLVIHGGRATPPVEPEMSGHTFIGWYIDTDLQKRYDFSLPVDNDIILYAKYVTGSSAVTVTVSFDTGGGSQVPSQTVVYGERVSEPIEPTRSGYTFNGWYVDESCEIRYNFDSSVFEDTIIYADWASDDGYLVEYEVEGTVVHSERHMAGDTVEVRERYEMLGYTVGFWKSDQVNLVGGSFIMPTYDVKISATATANEYTITFNVGYGANPIPDITLRYGEKIVPPDDPIAEGYVFMGWSPELPDTMPAEDLWIRAIFIEESMQTFVVTFDTNGGTPVDSMQIRVGAIISSEPTTSREGYVFAGWFTDESFSEPYDFKSLVTSDLSLHARWLKEGSAGTYKITFDVDDGNPIDPIYVAEGRTIDFFEPERPGYTFKGWYCDEDFTTAYVFQNPVTSDMTLHARWEYGETSKHTVISYEFPGQKPSTAVIEDGGTFSIYSLEYDHKKFTGWYLDRECTIPFDIVTPVTSNLTLYAGWEDYGWYTVTYQIDGEVVGDVEIVNNSFEQSLRDQYSFNGSTSSEWTSAQVKATDRFIMPETDVIFTATMSEEKHMVSFDSEGGDQYLEVVVGDGRNVPLPIPCRDGYIFDGWYVDESLSMPFRADDVVTSDITLHAKWMPIGWTDSDDNQNTEDGETAGTIGVLIVVIIVAIAIAIVFMMRHRS